MKHCLNVGYLEKKESISGKGSNEGYLNCATVEDFPIAYRLAMVII